jgi:nicotinic acid mononucleotide adenylyltransferase
MGVDQWLALERWNQPDRLAKLLTFIVFPRDNISPAPNVKFRSVFLTRAIKVSATGIRGKVRNDESISELVQPAVDHYIQLHALYQ